MAISKWLSATALDNGPAWVKANCTQQIACSNTTNPTAYGDLSGKILATATMASGDYSITGAAGANRTMAVGTKTGVTVSASGTYDCIVLLDASNNIHAVTTGTSQVLTSGNTCDFPAWNYVAVQPT